ncbi:geranylgeranylglyceryl/heptaprenylglyceryl phosphate synthase [Virgibacillus profundi]|uniref:Heptaprenylglyceryl phosphate synthase n=1 Tax=Virgibacillus profundi TaxID=2024555 RepID=A0A2A2I8S5_9BACI|nr:heptaprenylglyceryl phosphate synthase [Virgibacillus profundi]PAV28037.1 geranylgeranylglyceryl/heptaprenylglyceryl phosphate synthase [Virgibacillus profundi]PXY52215.1 heptaprenylglyceryl phosphate synthase [Virgibacillus profundi]
MMNEWKHIFKLDPAKEISDEDLEKICESGTDAVIVGGTDDITLDGVLDLLSRIRRYTVPCILEISSMEAITPGFDYYFIPMVMNSKEKKWMMDIQHQAIKQYVDMMEYSEIFFEGYCILNEDAKAFTHTNSYLPDTDDTIAYAYMAEKVFHLPIFYMEYSGTYGDPELVNKVKSELDNTLLFYGGGIENNFQAREMKEHADVIIVGNSIYSDIKKALKTVKAIK